MKSTWGLFLVSTIFFVLFLNLVSSTPVYNNVQVSIGKPGDCVSLPQSDINVSFENITGIQRPDNQIEVVGLLMTKNGNLFNYSYCNTNVTGIYTVNGCSDNDCWFYTFNITPTGDARGVSFFLIFTIGAIILFVIGYTAENEYIITIAGLLFGVAGVYTFIYGFADVNDLYTQIIGIILIGISIFLVIASIFEAIQDYQTGESESYSEDEGD